jgi:hypothetical protein
MEDDIEIRTRAGYKPAESLKAFLQALNESGTIATGRALHFSADLVLSGGYDVWIRTIWEFAIEHVGLASPRIFVYLKKRISELDALVSRLSEEDLWKNDEFQTRVSEIVFVLREQPRKTRIAWPKVGPETHRDGWLRSVSTTATESEVLKRVYKPSSDLLPMYTVGCELLKCCNEGGTEKALFWIKWLIDEDQRLRKENSGAGLSTLDRGPPSLKGKSKSEVSYYILVLFAEAYKELMVRKLIRMNEEFQALLDLYRGGEPRIGARSRRDILGLIAQILCEVPKWKVPAAPTLIKDPVTLSRAITQSANFFREVLAEPKVSTASVSKQSFRLRKESAKAREKAKKATTMEDQIEAYEAAMNIYLNK